MAIWAKLTTTGSSAETCWTKLSHSHLTVHKQGNQTFNHPRSKWYSDSSHEALNEALAFGRTENDVVDYRALASAQIYPISQVTKNSRWESKHNSKKH